eukprot:c16466_g1_i1.p2 GENE.c16466_g1_i1~~c16466_g1_i1.p2  ORF type:complete len:399 (-),score=90.88 c16466_g1_i1:87-1283(-)
MSGVVRNLANHCASLTRLDLTRSSISDNAAASIAQNLPGLTTISLAQVSGISPFAVSMIGERCKNLERISLTQMRVGLSSLMTLTRHASNLTHLDLAGCRDVGDVALQGFARGCRHLRRVNLRQCINASDKGVSPLVEACLQLEEIHLDGVAITDASLIALASYSKKLRSVSLSSHPVFHSLTSSALQNLGHGCPMIERLYLRSVRLAVGVFDGFPRLIHLSLVTCHLTSPNSKVSVLTALTPSARVCHHTPPCLLQTLELQGCSLSDVASRNIVEIAKTLRVFSLNDSFVSSSRLRPLIKAFGNLRSLSLISENKKFHVTETMVSMLVKTCGARLQHLTLGGTMNSDVVVGLVDGLVCLKHLVLRLHNRKREQLQNVSNTLRAINRPDLLWEFYGGA